MTISVLPFISVGIVGLFTLACLFLWATHDERGRSIQSICLVLLLVVFGLDLLALLLAPDGYEAGKPVLLLFLLPVSALSSYAVCYVGLVYLRKNTTQRLGYYAYATPQPYRSVRDFWRLDQKSILAGVIVTALAVLWTVVLFSAIDVSVSDALSDQITEEDDGTPVMYLVLASVALSEELLYRLGIQNFLSARFVARNTGAWVGIVGASSLWAIAHAGLVDPNWAKLLQIFVYGLGLGWLNYRFGVVICIASHITFNIVLAYLTTLMDLVTL